MSSIENRMYLWLKIHRTHTSAPKHKNKQNRIFVACKKNSAHTALKGFLLVVRSKTCGALSPLPLTYVRVKVFSYNGENLLFRPLSLTYIAEVYCTSRILELLKICIVSCMLKSISDPLDYLPKLIVVQLYKTFQLVRNALNYCFLS
jgi:hypothetical protein